MILILYLAILAHAQTAKHLSESLKIQLPLPHNPKIPPVKCRFSFIKNTTTTSPSRHFNEC